MQKLRVNDKSVVKSLFIPRVVASLKPRAECFSQMLEVGLGYIRDSQIVFLIRIVFDVVEHRLTVGVFITVAYGKEIFCSAHTLALHLYKGD